MKKLVEKLVDDRVVVAAIVLNSVALFAMGFTDPSLSSVAAGRGAISQSVFRTASTVDYICVAYFVIEIALLLATQGRKKFWQSGWNRFDLTIVLLSSPVLLRPILDTQDWSVVLVLRLGRLLRLFRTMRFIPNREHIYAGIKRALRASVGVALALFFINLVLALGATQLFGRLVPEHFGNPAISSYSLFRVFTVEGWHELPELVAQRGSTTMGHIARVYFAISVLLGGILGLSLANAVFVDEMTLDNNEKLEGKIDTLTDEIKQLRLELDANNLTSQQKDA
jgi:voltage-gated sodium channel